MSYIHTKRFFFTLLLQVHCGFCFLDVQMVAAFWEPLTVLVWLQMQTQWKESSIYPTHNKGERSQFLYFLCFFVRIHNVKDPVDIKKSLLRILGKVYNSRQMNIEYFFHSFSLTGIFLWFLHVWSIVLGPNQSKHYYSDKLTFACIQTDYQRYFVSSLCLLMHHC